MEIIKVAVIIWIILIAVIELFKYLLKKVYFKMKMEEEDMRMEESKAIEDNLNKKLNVEGKLHSMETIKYLYGHPELDESKEILICIFNYGIVLIDKGYKGSGFEHFMTIKKEDIIDVSFLKPVEIKEYKELNDIEIIENKDDEKIHYLKVIYKLEEKEHTLMLSSEREQTEDRFGNSNEHHSLKIVMLMYSINSITGKSKESTLEKEAKNSEES